MVNRSYVQRISENHLKNMADRAEMPEVCGELRFGYTESECREALMCFYDLLKEMQIDIKRTRTQFQNIAKNVFINTDDFSDRRPLFNRK